MVMLTGMDLRAAEVEIVVPEAIRSLIVVPGMTVRLVLVATQEHRPKSPSVKVPPRVAEFIDYLKSIASKAAAPYPARIIPADPYADQARLITYISRSGLLFRNFSNDENRRIVKATWAELQGQLKMRKGEQLLWLMECAHQLKWWRAPPVEISDGPRGRVSVVLGDEYRLTFASEEGRLELSEIEDLQDPDGGD
ncbi:MAG TPA: hypothetical protein VHO06_22005 [Polyangia bacterium]|nr:hypothetical protein [Polyangia bacterium]